MYPGMTLPTTGLALGWWAVLGITLVAAGAALYRIARTRRWR